jgi:putative membrane protein
MFRELPYCGVAPIPGELWTRFNPDPVLIVAILLGAGVELWITLGARRKRQRTFVLIGWAVAAAAYISPLCALSVSLYSARAAQQMILVLIAAPLIALGLPALRAAREGWVLWISVLVFFFALWFWQMPQPYDSTFSSVAIYWCMHVTVFSSAIWLWHELLHHPPQRTAEAFIAGAVTSMQLGLLGAMLSLAGHPIFRWHLITTWAWGLTPLEDQQLGGVVMWAPAIALFMWTAIRSLVRLWASMEGLRTPLP